MAKVRTRWLVGVLAAGALLSGAGWRAMAKPPTGGGEALKLSELGWMAGRWQSDAKSGFTDEHWAEPLNGAMVGMCRIGDDGSKAVYEMLLIEEIDGKLVYSMEHFGPGLKRRDKETMKFDVRRGAGAREVVFEGRDSEKRTRLTYRSATPDELVCILEKQRDGKELRSEFQMRRAPGR